MTDEIEWGPWIEHDGRAPNQAPKGATHFSVRSVRNSGKTLVEDDVYPDPGFFWSWRRKWLIGPRVRVCDQPEYAPIIAYRFGKKKGRSAAIDRLAEIAANPSTPITAPEGPTREKVPANNTRDRA